MTASLDFEQVPEMDNQGIRRFLGLDPDDYAGIYYCKSADPMQAGEIVLVKFKDDEDADSFLSKMESHRDERTNLFAGYAPDEEQLLKNSILEAEANFAVFLVNQDAQTMYEIFKEEIAR
ncbi:MAG: DUF4358 domain-containing protein [Firmicutes bacterium]|nr:DUF4358 domain-containing protein [Bacillota bacterium]